MGIFGTTSPFDQDVEKATSENNTSEEWGLILEICDRAGAGGAASARDCLRAVLRRLAHPDPHVQLQAATLLDALVSNCPRALHLEVASRDFEAEFRRLVARAQPAVAARLRALLRKWAEGEFRDDPQLDLIVSLWRQLRAEAPPGEDGAAPSEPARSAAPAAAAQREQEELARAIALSLREAAPATAAPAAPAALYPRVDAEPAPARKVRALYDFEAAEDNELTFYSGEIVHVTDSSDPNWWKGYSERGEGLFPANFVTGELAEAAGGVVVAAGGGGAVMAGAARRSPSPEARAVERIEPGVLDAALALLHEADPASGAADPPALRPLELRAQAVGALVDAALQRADGRHARLTSLSAELVRALNLYHELMRSHCAPYYPPTLPHPPRC